MRRLESGSVLFTGVIWGSVRTCCRAAISNGEQFGHCGLCVLLYAGQTMQNTRLFGQVVGAPCYKRLALLKELLDVGLSLLLALLLLVL